MGNPWPADYLKVPLKLIREGFRQAVGKAFRLVCKDSSGLAEIRQENRFFKLPDCRAVGESQIEFAIDAHAQGIEIRRTDAGPVITDHHLEMGHFWIDVNYSTGAKQASGGGKIASTQEC